MELLKKKDSKYYWYDFTVAGCRYRGSTKESNEKRAGSIAAIKLAQIVEGKDPLPRKAPRLAWHPVHKRSTRPVACRVTSAR